MANNDTPFSSHFKSGEHYSICDVCGKKFHSSELKLRWDGALVCNKDFENRQPQDYVRAKKDKITPTGPIRPPHDPEYVSVTKGTNPAPTVPSGTFDNSI